MKPHPNIQANNVINDQKKTYILAMRGDLCHKDLIKKDQGNVLNLPYFKVKKGQYWTPEAQRQLEKAVLEHGAYDFQKIRDVCFPEEDKHGNKIRSPIEIKLRLSKLLRIYDLEGYKDRQFGSLEEIKQEAAENLAKAKELAKSSNKKHLVGGVWMKRPEKTLDVLSSFASSFFKKQDK